MSDTAQPALIDDRANLIRDRSPLAGVGRFKDILKALPAASAPAGVGLFAVSQPLGNGWVAEGVVCITRRAP